MRFWDSSAVVPLLVAEPASARMRAILETDPEMMVWWSTPVECLSALARRVRDGGLGPAETGWARRVLGRLQESWAEVLPGDRVREEAATLLWRHDLRAADALQLAAARVWTRGRPDGYGLCTLDEGLGNAAAGEGFTVLPGTEQEAGF